MPITYLINPAISIFKSKIEKKIDEAIENQWILNQMFYRH